MGIFSCMITCVKSTILKACMNIMFMDYVYNVNTQKDIDVLKNDIVISMDIHKSKESMFEFNVLKRCVLIQTNHFNYIYPNYSNYFEDIKCVLDIQNNDTFMIEFKKFINECDELFVLFLLSVEICKNIRI